MIQFYYKKYLLIKISLLNFTSNFEITIPIFIWLIFLFHILITRSNIDLDDEDGNSISIMNKDLTIRQLADILKQRFAIFLFIMIPFPSNNKGHIKT